MDQGATNVKPAVEAPSVPMTNVKLNAKYVVQIIFARTAAGDQPVKIVGVGPDVVITASGHFALSAEVDLYVTTDADAPFVNHAVGALFVSMVGIGLIVNHVVEGPYVSTNGVDLVVMSVRRSQPPLPTPHSQPNLPLFCLSQPSLRFFWQFQLSLRLSSHLSPRLSWKR